MSFYLFHHLQAGIYHRAAKESPITYRQLILMISYLSFLTFLTRYNFLGEIPAGSPYTNNIGFQMLRIMTPHTIPVLLYVYLRMERRRREDLEYQDVGLVQFQALDSTSYIYSKSPKNETPHQGHATQNSVAA